MRKNLSWAIHGSVFYVLSQWALLIILAKLGGSSTVGRYTLGLAVTAPIILFSNLQLRAMLASDAHGTFSFSVYAGVRVLTSVGSLVLIGLVVFLIDFTAEQAVVILLIGLAKAIESGSDLVYGVMQKHERMDLVGLSKAVRGVLTIGVMGGVLYGTESLIAGVVGLNIVWLLVLVLVDVRHLVKFADIPRVSLNWSGLASGLWSTHMRRLSRQALPLGVVSMLISYNSSAPRYFLEMYHGEAVLGYFSAITCFTVACTIVPEAFGQAALPRLARHHVESGLDYWRLLTKLVGVALLIGVMGLVVATVFGSEILSLVYQPEFAPYSHILVMVMVLGMAESLCSVLGIGLIASRRLVQQVPVLTIVLLVTAFTAWWLVPNHGMEGAVVAAIAGMGVWIAAYCWVLRIPREVSTRSRT